MSTQRNRLFVQTLIDCYLYVYHLKGNSPFDMKDMKPYDSNKIGGPSCDGMNRNLFKSMMASIKSRVLYCTFEFCYMYIYKSIYNKYINLFITNPLFQFTYHQYSVILNAFYKSLLCVNFEKTNFRLMVQQQPGAHIVILYM